MKLINNDLIATGLDNGAITLWDIKNGLILKELNGPHNKTKSIEYLSNGTLVSIADAGKQIVFWNIKDERRNLIKIYNENQYLEYYGLNLTDINTVKIFKDGIFIERILNYSTPGWWISTDFLDWHKTYEYTIGLWNSSLINFKANSSIQLTCFKILKDGSLIAGSIENKILLLNI